MNHFKHKLQHSPGQALVEFALIIGALLAMIFLLIESARILWAWNTVQHAAREGARYAVTGSFETPDCAVDFAPLKFQQTAQQGGRDVCDDLRLASVIAQSHEALSGLPLNEASTAFEDDNYYNIEVWGANEFGQLQYDFAGIPDNPVIVRVIYRVPIITPFFRPIRTSIPVFGQEVLNNESFGQLSSTTGQSLPPNLPPLPTPGVTPSPTPTPIFTDTPSPTPTVPTPTNTVDPTCPVQFEGLVIEAQDYVYITGEVGSIVTITDLTEGSQPIGVGTIAGPFGGHACPGFVTVSVPPSELITGHVLGAISNDGTTDTTIVLGASPTDTPTPTLTPLPSATPSPTYTPLPSATPSSPYIVLQPTCGTPLNNPDLVQFNVTFVNWPTNQSLTVFWNGNLLQNWQPGQHAGSFTQSFTRSLQQITATYTVTAVAGGGATDYELFYVPCTEFPTVTPGTTPTHTPAPPDLVVFGPPQLVSTPPIVAYQPVQFRVPITNTGDIDVNSQFFVDIYLDPNPTLVLTTTIPITESDGYSAVSSLPGGDSRMITITSQLGFANQPVPHAVYGFVDSLERVIETNEDNNITEGLTSVQVTPAATPTPSPTPGGGVDEISGGALTLGDDLVLQFRAQIYLIDDYTGNVVRTQSDINGFYAFTGVATPTTWYTVAGCITIDGEDWYGFLTGILPPNTTAHVIMLERPCPYNN
jgi:Flp pilus assembly protein TadG